MQSAQPKNHALAKFVIPTIVIASIIITAAITGGIFFTAKNLIASSASQWDESQLGDYPFNSHRP
jgi:hypothetical protein